MDVIATVEDNALQAQPQRLTDIYQRFINYIDAKPKSIETYTRALRQMFNYFADNSITQPRSEDVKAFREYLKATGHKPTTIQNYITAARLFFKFAEHEHIYENIADGIKGANLDREHKKDYLTSAQIKAILDGVDRSTPQGVRDYAIIALMVTGGLRTIEVNRALISDIRALGDNTVLYVQGKGRDEKTEYIKLSAPVEAAIRAYLRQRGETASDAPLFSSMSNNSKGAAMTTRSISRIVKEAMIKAGYNSDRLTAHSLRHTAVTLSLLAGQPLEEVQQFARHANISTTMIYNHALDKAKNGCSAAISNAIF